MGMRVVNELSQIKYGKYRNMIRQVLPDATYLIQFVNCDRKLDHGSAFPAFTQSIPITPVTFVIQHRGLNMSAITPPARHAAALKKVLLLTLMAAGLWSGAAQAGNDDCLSCGVSNASLAIPAASGIVVGGSLSVVAASGIVIVKGVETVGDSVVVVFKGASDAATASVRLTGQAARGASLVVGSAVEVVAVSTGSLLVASGKAIAFIPNEIGLALLHQSRVR
jgi:hypothetical protein